MRHQAVSGDNIRTRRIGSLIALFACTSVFAFIFSGCAENRLSNKKGKESHSSMPIGRANSDNEVRGDGRLTQLCASLSEDQYELFLTDLSVCGNNSPQISISRCNTKDSEAKISIQTDENIAKEIKIVVDEGTKKIRIEGVKNHRYNFSQFVVTVCGCVKKVALCGAHHIDFDLGTLDSFCLAAEGAINGNLHGEINKCDFLLSGEGKLDISGMKTKKLHANAEGSIEIKGEGVSVAATNFSICGEGTCSVNDSH
jgi:hypothetical protein